MIEITVERYNELIRAEMGCKLLCDIIKKNDDSYTKLEYLRLIGDVICQKEEGE